MSECIADAIVSLVDACPDTAFMEIGIGTGRIALPLIRRGYKYTGIDVSGPMLGELRHKLEHISHRCSLIQADASTLSIFSDSSFDVVLSCHVLHSLPDLSLALSEIGRVLKPTGTYLHCLDMRPPHQQEIDRYWQSLLVELDPRVQQFQYGYAMREEEITAQLRIRGASINSVVIAEWDVEQTLGQVLAAYEAKGYPSCLRVPDDVFNLAIQQFKDDCLQHYGSETTRLSSRTSFRITSARYSGHM